MSKNELLTENSYTKLFSDLRKLWEVGKARARSAVNYQLLATYWEIGGRIAMENLTANVGYEKTVLARLAKDMQTDVTTLYRCIQFHGVYKAVPRSDFLSWSHYRVLLAIKDSTERRKFSDLAEKNRWTRDQLLEAVESAGKDVPTDGSSKKLKRPTTVGYVFKGIVLDVVDGDTLVLDIDCGFDIKKKQRIRLSGINSPEINTTEGQDAATFVRNQLAQAPFVVVRTTKVDINGRFLGDVFYSFDSKANIEEVYRGGRYLNQELLSREMGDRM